LSLSPQWLDELRSRITLSGVIGRTTKIQKAGREWKACCPFHNEKTPSFTINDEKGFYHCFGCGAHGDVIRWMTDQRGLTFMDAVKELAAQAGIEVPAADPRAAKKAEERAGLHDVMAAAQDWFLAQLGNDGGQAARAYLATRGFDARTVERFGFGYAPDNRTALKTALKQFGDPMLVEAGLLIAVEDKEPYDRFRGRLMLPIHDARGRVIAFGGRILAKDKTDAPKYLNSPDTPLFDKGRTLYNLHRAGPASRKTNRMVVVEGYMDVIALAAAGIEEAVAPLGTALTEQQIEMLWRLVEVPVLCFDGDAAGQRAAMRAITRALPLLRPGHSLRIVRLPQGLDPDDLIKQQGTGAMERLLSEATTLLEALWDNEVGAQPLNSPEEKAGLKARLMEHVEAIQHPDIRALYKRELTDRFSTFAFPPRPPRAPFVPAGNKGRGNFTPAKPQISAEVVQRLRHAAAGGGRDRLASGVIAGLLRFPDQVARHADLLARFECDDPEIARDIDALLEAAEALESSGDVTIWASSSDGSRQARVPFTFLAADADPAIAREELAGAVSLLVERPALEAALRDATARFESDPEGSWAEQQRLRKRKLEFERRLGQMASDQAAAVARNRVASPSEASQQELD
jgi:DNA primase